VERLKKHKEILLILFLAAVAVLTAGLTSEVSVGDEVYHYRFAKDMYAAGRRVPFDPLYPTGNPPGYFYNSEPFWSGFLAILWRLTGNISFPLAQIYHTFYYLLLIVLTYLIGNQIYGKREGLFAALLIASAPMVVTFGILFYLDVPGTAFAALSLLLFLKKRYFLTGLGISLMYFTRRNGCFLVPGFMLVLWLFDKESLITKLKNSIFLILPTAILAPFDLRWRRIYIETPTFTIPGVGKYTSGGAREYIVSRLAELMTKFIWGSGEYLNSSLINPRDVIQYFGVALLAGMFLYFLFKKNKKEDLPLWVCVIFYFVFYAYLFGINSDIRYIFPIIPLLCVLAGSSFKSIGSLKWLKGSILVVCLLQLLGTSFYVHQRRLIPAGMKEGFEFIKQNTPVNALFMYPGYILTEATGRKFIWSSFFQVEGWVVSKKYPTLDFSRDKSALMFWNNKEDDIKEILKVNKLHYIVIDKSRIYDDTKVKNFGGYPKSFVERLPTLPLFKKIFENQAMSIWKVNREKSDGIFQ
jgi:4-amino-4-deoxy-L-arabinose transferase-like glycosyltransferase